MSDIDNFEALRKSLNQNRELITRTIRVYKFFDKLRSHNILSLEDYEEIDNSARYPTSAEKAGHLLDVVDTKGPNGLNVFVQCLDDEYPDLYEKVTGLESSPRNYIRTPDPVGRVHPFIDIEGVQRLSAQLDELSQKRAQDQLAITELREELFKLRFINTTCRSKLSRYPQLLKKQKQMDLEIQELKEENFNMVLKISNLEKDRSKLKFERKEHKQMIDQLKQKLEDAVNMHTSQKHCWERTNSKNEQLAEDKNNLEKKLEHMQREIDTVKRQSSLWSNRSFQDSMEESGQDDLQARIDILISDKEMLESKNSELVNRLYEAKNGEEKRRMKYEKMKAEYEELKHLLQVMQKDLRTTDKHYKLTWQQLQKVSAERNQAYDQRSRAQAESQESCKERDRLQERLNRQLRSFKDQLYGQNRTHDMLSPSDDLLSPETGISRFEQLRRSGYSDTSGISSDIATHGSDIESARARKSATLPLPSVTSHNPHATLNGRPISDVSEPDSLDEFRHRLRSRPITGRSSSVGLSRNGHNPFPERDFLLQILTKLENAQDNESDEERADLDVCQQGCVTPDDVAKNFAEKRPHFADSLRSDLATRGSDKSRDHHKRVDLWIMKQSFKVRPPLNTSFSIDYDDEHEDLEAIFSNNFEAMDPGALEDTKRRKQLHRRSRSLDDLNFSSDDSDDLRQVKAGGRKSSKGKARFRRRHGGLFDESADSQMTPEMYKNIVGITALLNRGRSLIAGLSIMNQMATFSSGSSAQGVKMLEAATGPSSCLARIVGSSHQDKY